MSVTPFRINHFKGKSATRVNLTRANQRLPYAQRAFIDLLVGLCTQTTSNERKTTVF